MIVGVLTTKLVLLQIFIYVIPDLVVNNNNSIANCVFCLSKKK